MIGAERATGFVTPSQRFTVAEMLHRYFVHGQNVSDGIKIPSGIGVLPIGSEEAAMQ